MKCNTIGIAFVLFLFASPAWKAVAQIGGGGGACTNLGCIVLSFMAPYDSGSGTRYCMEFAVPTGRKVRNSQGIQGGNPVSTGGTQTVKVFAFDCSECAVGPLERTAVAGTPVVGVFTNQSFGRYNCN